MAETAGDLKKPIINMRAEQEREGIARHWMSDYWLILYETRWLLIPGSLDGLAIGVLGGGSYLFLQENFFASTHGDGDLIQCGKLNCAYWDGVYISGPLPQCNWCMRGSGDLALWLGWTAFAVGVVHFFTVSI